MGAAEILSIEGPSPAAQSRLAEIATDLRAARLVPYLGPQLLALDGAAPVPSEPEALAMALNAKVAVSGRIRGNVWATAQFIESHRHRKTLTHIMGETFAPPVAPNALQRYIAGLKVPFIVDTWYDGAMRTALAESGRTDWVEIQGITRGAEYRDIWTKTYDPTGQEIDPARAMAATTILYKPHGAITPARNFLISDSDYVEVLTEIDIQTPIPDVIKARRTDRRFLFLGNRFHDQMLRTFARQIVKRAGQGHVAIVEAGKLTRNEARFLAEAGIEIIDCPLAQACAALRAE